MAAKKILVVDDEPDVVTLLETTLKSEGYVVLPAYDGIAALDICNTDKPDLVLLDIMMPMMSGPQVALGYWQDEARTTMSSTASAARK